MPPRQSSFSSQATRRSRKAGCLSFFLLPLAGALAIGFAIVVAATSTGLNFSNQPYGQGGTAEPGHLAPFFSPTVQFWGSSIDTWAGQLKLEPNLIATVMQIESCGDPQITSPAGASGLFQVMPFHFKDGENPQDPQVNALRGLTYLKKVLDTANGDIHLALASYNGGLSLINQDETQWPEETKNYTYWGTSIYQDAIHGNKASKALNQWLFQNGWKLCLQARQRLGLRP